jgi:uncharacterized phosphosugar-binding protein
VTQLVEAAMSEHLRSVVALLERLEATNGRILDEVADRVIEVVQNDRIIHVAGTGHSIICVLEAFDRAGGLACVNPIWHPALLPLNGGAISNMTERIPGFGGELVRSAQIGPGDLLFVYSNSGINAVPVEIARDGRKAGAYVVAVVSSSYAAVPSRQPDGFRLADVADVVVDTGVPLGDAIQLSGAGMEAVAPASTYAGVYVWNSILARVALLAEQSGARLPIWRSANAPGHGPDADLVARYASRVRQL